MYEYAAQIEKVVDGDTVDASVDLGFSVHVKERLRLFGLNAPEHRSVAGDEATVWLRAQLPVGTWVIIKTQKDKTEKYGRMLATIILSDGTDVNAALIASGHALAWDGKGARPV